MYIKENTLPMETFNTVLKVFQKRPILEKILLIVPNMLICKFPLKYTHGYTKKHDNSGNQGKEIEYLQEPWKHFIISKTDEVNLKEQCCGHLIKPNKLPTHW